MPHTVTTHGVLSDPRTPDGRNLFTLDAMIPMIWRGLVVMPEEAAERLRAMLRDRPVVAIGKGRSVRVGRPSGRPRGRHSGGMRTGTAHTVLVVQSPLLLSDVPIDGMAAEEELMAVAIAWARMHDLPAPKPQGTWANVGILFGWNRHASGAGGLVELLCPGR